MKINGFGRLVLAAVMVCGLGFAFAGRAQAGGYGYGHDSYYGHYDNYDHNCGYKTVVDYVYKQVPTTVCVTRYDHCGVPYTDHVTVYKTISVPVYRQVPVCY